MSKFVGRAALLAAPAVSLKVSDGQRGEAAKLQEQIIEADGTIVGNDVKAPTSFMQKNHHGEKKHASKAEGKNAALFAKNLGALSEAEFAVNSVLQLANDKKKSKKEKDEHDWAAMAAVSSDDDLSSGTAQLACLMREVIEKAFVPAATGRVQKGQLPDASADFNTCFVGAATEGSESLSSSFLESSGSDESVFSVTAEYAGKLNRELKDVGKGFQKVVGVLGKESAALETKKVGRRGVKAVLEAALVNLCVTPGKIFNMLGVGGMKHLVFDLAHMGNGAPQRAFFETMTEILKSKLPAVWEQINEQTVDWAEELIHNLPMAGISKYLFAAEAQGGMSNPKANLASILYDNVREPFLDRLNRAIDSSTNHFDWQSEDAALALLAYKLVIQHSPGVMAEVNTKFNAAKFKNVLSFEHQAPMVKVINELAQEMPPTHGGICAPVPYYMKGAVQFGGGSSYLQKQMTSGTSKKRDQKCYKQGECDLTANEGCLIFPPQCEGKEGQGHCYTVHLEIQGTDTALALTDPRNDKKNSLSPEVLNNPSGHGIHTKTGYNGAYYSFLEKWEKEAEAVDSSLLEMQKVTKKGRIATIRDQMLDSLSLLEHKKKTKYTGSGGGNYGGGYNSNGHGHNYGFAVSNAGYAGANGHDITHEGNMIHILSSKVAQCKDSVAELPAVGVHCPCNDDDDCTRSAMGLPGGDAPHKKICVGWHISPPAVARPAYSGYIAR